MRFPRFIAIAAALSTVAFAAPSTASGPADDLPDRGPALSERAERGDLILLEARDVSPSLKTIDGDPSDWVGQSARVAGNSHYDAGEFIHTDFLFDAYGADSGDDIARWNQFAGNLYAVERTERLDDLMRTTGSQLGVPEPIGADDEYGDADRSLAEADLTELRVAAQGDDVLFLLRFSNMTDASRVGVQITNQLGTVTSGVGCVIPESIQPCVQPVEGTLGNAVLVRPGAGVTDLADGTLVSGAAVAAEAAGWTNTIEVRIPAAALIAGDSLDLNVITGTFDEAGEFTPLNIAFRHAEPVDIYNDRMQAFALHGDAPDGSTVSGFSSGPIQLADLRQGRTQAWTYGAGYHEVLFTSGENISQEVNKDSLTQHYGLAVPTAYKPDNDLDPVNYWMHYRGGKAHSAAGINPRLVWAHGEEIDALFVSPRGRGTSTWYVTQAHQDFFEVMADVEARFPDTDPQRRYLSGYSMGGYGTWLMSTLYPDMFAAGFSVSGAITQGAWLGTEGDHCQYTFDEYSACYIEANSGDAAAQLTYRLLENLRYFPIAIDHGTDDELVPIPQIERQAARLTELGYAHRLTRFLGYEHFSQAAVEEWSDGTNYQASHVLPENVRQVTYKVVPALIDALNTKRLQGWQDRFEYNPDGAWWVDDIVARNTDVEDDQNFAMIDAISFAVDEGERLAIPDSGTASPLHHSTPSVRTGLQLVELPLERATSNRLDVELTGVASATVDFYGAELRTDTAWAFNVTADGPGELLLAGWDGLQDGATWSWFGVTTSSDGGDLTFTMKEVDGGLLVTWDAAGSFGDVFGPFSAG